MRLCLIIHVYASSFFGFFVVTLVIMIRVRANRPSVLSGCEGAGGRDALTAQKRG